MISLIICTRSSFGIHVSISQFFRVLESFRSFTNAREHTPSSDYSHVELLPEVQDVYKERELDRDGKGELGFYQ